MYVGCMYIGMYVCMYVSTYLYHLLSIYLWIYFGGRGKGEVNILSRDHGFNRNSGVVTL